MSVRFSDRHDRRLTVLPDRPFKYKRAASTLRSISSVIRPLRLIIFQGLPTEPPSLEGRNPSGVEGGREAAVGMDSDQGKLFIGGISWETTEDKLREYFGKYGEVMQAVIMRDKISGRPRGFGFVVFADPTLVDRVLQDKHTIDGRVVRSFLSVLNGFLY